MSPEKTKSLSELYPKIFRMDDSMKSEPFYHYHFECGDGWYDLISMLCLRIQSRIDHKSKDMNKEDAEDFQVVAQQVKEKFGGLRFYHSGGDEYIQGIVSFAEAMSYITCEVCGDKATVRTTGWIRNICQRCDDSEKERTKAVDDSQ